MNHKKFALVALSILGLGLLLAASPTKAQLPPGPPPGYHYHPVNLNRALSIRVQPRTTLYPPLQSDMTTDVMDGYIFFDSIARSVNVLSGQFDSILNTIYDSDTLRYALKYLYEMIDWDPITFSQYCSFQPIMSGVNSGGYKNTSIYHIYKEVLNRACTVIPDSGKLFAYLTDADAILHVHVIDTVEHVSAEGDTSIRVHCTIVDPIKGQRLLPCNDYYVAKRYKGMLPATDSGACLEFEYSYAFEQQIRDPAFGYTAHRSPPWILPGNDYIVFLKYQGLGGDSTGRYMTLMPMPAGGDGVSNIQGFSTMMSVYAIQTGIVNDPWNDFGIGTNRTVSDFKSRLRSKIQSITSAE